MELNYYILLILAPILVLVGIAGFLVPASKSLTSGATAYNIFHIVFGLIGLAVVFWGDRDFVRWFNISFGAIDLYQAAASWLGLFPAKLFKWKRTDDILHFVIGAALVLIGVLG